VSYLFPSAVIGAVALACFALGALWATWRMVIRSHAWCACGHPCSLHDIHDGRCRGRVNQAWWAHRLLGVKRLEACRCINRGCATPAGATARTAQAGI
jgi:hypothetical protein